MERISFILFPILTISDEKKIISTLLLSVLLSAIVSMSSNTYVKCEIPRISVNLKMGVTTTINMQFYNTPITDEIPALI